MGDSTNELVGQCLCGGVRFRTRGKLRGVIYCHCSQCRRQSGHFVAATKAFDPSRHNCTQCHVPQVDAPALVENRFIGNIK